MINHIVINSAMPLHSLIQSAGIYQNIKGRQLRMMNLIKHFLLKKADDFMCTDEDGLFGVPGTCQGLYYACFAGITIEQVSCAFSIV